MSADSERFESVSGRAENLHFSESKNIYLPNDLYSGEQCKFAAYVNARFKGFIDGFDYACNHRDEL